MTAADRDAESVRRWQDAAICLVLATAVLVSFGRVVRFGFVGFDDPQYVSENENVNKGITAAGVRWALTTWWQGNWHPLTWLSHMLDCQVFGLWPGGHHLVNILMHAGSSVLLFLVLRRSTGARWESAFAAALFAVHPLRVESVAWVAERKDVLSMLLFMLALFAYVRYVERPTPGRYAAVLVWYVLGLLAKPMLVTTPFVLLLLDDWPLRRTRWSRLVLEKLPMLAIAAASSVVTFFAQRAGAALVEGLPVSWRLGNAAVGYVRYLGKTFCPTNLSIFYPLQAVAQPAAKVAAAVGVLAVITLLAVWCARRWPYVTVGWLWFVGTLVPVVGIVQVGSQSIADRYTYLPSIGLTIAVVWAAAESGRRWDIRRESLAKIGGIVVVILMACTFVQAGYWRDTLTLFSHAIDATGPDNNLAQWYVAGEYLKRGDDERALEHYLAALRVKWHGPRVHYLVGNILQRRGEFDEAIRHYEAAVEQDPQLAEGYNNLGAMYGRKGDLDRAEFYFREALRVDPNMDLARRGLDRVRELKATTRP